MRYVITGASSCGKTTLIDELRKRCYQVVEEVATEVLEDRFDQEVTREEIEIRQRLIFKRQLRRENFGYGLRDIFFDRGLVDCLVYSQFYLGNVPEDIFNFDFSKRYDGVFLLDKLPFEKNQVRVEKDGPEAEAIYHKLKASYESFGYSPIVIPVKSVSERANLILNIVALEDGMH